MLSKERTKRNKSCALYGATYPKHLPAACTQNKNAHVGLERVLGSFYISFQFWESKFNYISYEHHFQKIGLTKTSQTVLSCCTSLKFVRCELDILAQILWSIVSFVNPQGNLACEPDESAKIWLMHLSPPPSCLDKFPLDPAHGLGADLTQRRTVARHQSRFEKSHLAGVGCSRLQACADTREDREVQISPFIYLTVVWSTAPPHT